jgi:segregation and condensation protein B
LAVLEACVYVVEEPLMPAQIAAALNQDPERIRGLMQQLMAEFERPEHGVSIKEVAGGYKMATKPEHHEAVRSFVKSLKAPLKLSLPALETLAVVAYKQPVTSPEIMEIRGVQGGGVLKTLLDRKLITEAGRKNVIGKPILYKTTKEFLIQFGLKDLSELPTLKEFEEIRRMAFADGDAPTEVPVEATEAEAVAPEVPAVDAEISTPEAEAAAPEVPVLDAEAPQTEARTDSEVPSSEPEAASDEAAVEDATVPPAEAHVEAPTTEPEVSTPEPETATSEAPVHAHTPAESQEK